MPKSSHLISLPLMISLAACGSNEAAPTDCSGNRLPTAPGEHDAKLTWAAPTTKSDGSPLTDLVGYRIYLGTKPDDLEQAIEICSPSITSWIVTGLSSGTWYFAVAAVDSENVESERTNVVSRHID